MVWTRDLSSDRDAFACLCCRDITQRLRRRVRESPESALEVLRMLRDLGETESALRETLVQSQRLRVAAVLGAARDIAKALERAHAQASWPEPPAGVGSGGHLASA